MGRNLKIILVSVILIIITVLVVFAIINIEPHKPLNINEIKEIELTYRYSQEKKTIPVVRLNSVLDEFNKLTDHEKVYSEIIPCYSITIHLNSGTTVKIVDIHQDEYLLVERTFLGYTTKYELKSKALVEAVSEIVKDTYDIHSSRVCVENKNQ